MTRSLLPGERGGGGWGGSRVWGFDSLKAQSQETLQTYDLTSKKR